MQQGVDRLTARLLLFERWQGLLRCGLAHQPSLTLGHSQDCRQSDFLALEAGASQKMSQRVTPKITAPPARVTHRGLALARVP